MLSGAALNALELCLCAGLGLMAWSWLARRRRNFLAGVPETHIAELRPGVTAAVTGVAEAPELLVSPVSKTPCVFYEAQVYVQESRPPYFDDGTFPDSGDPTMGPKLVWVRGSREQVGGFYVRNGAFRAFVLPRGAALRISRERRNSTEETEPSTVRRITERFIPPGATVSVVGRRRDLGEAIEALRRDASIAPDALRRLLDAGSVPCFFDDGIEPFMVADKAFAALKADAVESADAIFWAGAAVFAMSLFVGAAALLGLI